MTLPPQLSRNFRMGDRSHVKNFSAIMPRKEQFCIIARSLNDTRNLLMLWPTRSQRGPKIIWRNWLLPLGPDWLKSLADLVRVVIKCVEANQDTIKQSDRSKVDISKEEECVNAIMLLELLLLLVKFSLSSGEDVPKYDKVWVKNDDFQVQWTGSLGFIRYK